MGVEHTAPAAPAGVGAAAEPVPGPDAARRRPHIIAALLVLALFAVVLVRTAWVCDDAFITLRTVDNALHGYGLRWNVDERVQTYTHPLWMGVLLVSRAMTRELFYTTIALSLVASLAAVALVLFRLAHTWAGALAAGSALIFSRAFMDYSTGGLENPLTHLLYVAFLAFLLRQDTTERPATAPRDVGALALLACLGMLNRLDTALLFAPPLAIALWRARGRRTVLAAAAAFAPLVAWEVFSLLYYGFPFPNTAYAKVFSPGIPQAELYRQGWAYLADSVLFDPPTLAVILGGFVVGCSLRSWRTAAIALGVALYVGYVVRIGGDFMRGRFLAAPLLGGAVLLARWSDVTPKRNGILAALVVAILGCVTARPTLLSGARYGVNEPGRIEPSGIADERAIYYPAFGLLRFSRRQSPRINDGAPIEIPRTVAGRAPASGERRVEIGTGVGWWGFIAGPRVHVIDVYALGDPLLARLPMPYTPTWRPGHFVRAVPAGYAETVGTGRIALADAQLGAYYEQLALITRGPIFSGRRLAATWRMNARRYDHLIDFARYRYPGMRHATPEALAAERRPVAVSPHGVQVDFGARTRAPRVRLELAPEATYGFVLVRGDREVWFARRRVEDETAPAGAVQLTLRVPAWRALRGYDALRVLPVSGTCALAAAAPAP